MSNFICSECGMNNIDCGRDGYKTPREIELEKKLNKAEDAIREAYWKCENCYKGVCQYCLNSGVKCYMQGNKVESVGKLKEKLDIAMDTLEMLAHLRKEFDGRYREFAKNGIKQIEDIK